MFGSFSRLALSFCAGVTVLATACGGGGGDGASGDGGQWKLVLMRHGSSVVVPVDAMNVYLTEDEFSPEQFAIQGDNVALMGAFPSGMKVGYEEDWNVLMGKTLIIAPEGMTADGTAQSFVQLADGERASVLSGTVIFEKVSGNTAGQDGDITLSGRVMLVVRGGGGTENLIGTIAVHGITWG